MCSLQPMETRGNRNMLADATCVAVGSDLTTVVLQSGPGLSSQRAVEQGHHLSRNLCLRISPASPFRFAPPASPTPMVEAHELGVELGRPKWYRAVPDCGSASHPKRPDRCGCWLALF